MRAISSHLYTYHQPHYLPTLTAADIPSVLINSWHTCTVRVTVVGSVCPFVCLSVCPLHPHCRDPALPPLYGHHRVDHFSCRKHAYVLWYLPRGGSSHLFPCGCAEKVVVSFVSCNWSCLQARSVHNVMPIDWKCANLANMCFRRSDKYSIRCQPKPLSDCKFLLSNCVNFVKRLKKVTKGYRTNLADTAAWQRM